MPPHLSIDMTEKFTLDEADKIYLKHNAVNVYTRRIRVYYGGFRLCNFLLIAEFQWRTEQKSDHIYYIHIYISFIKYFVLGLA